MKKAYFVGLDIAKNILQVFLADEKGRQIADKKMSRSIVKTFFANLESCTVGHDACGSAHYWARTLESYGNTVPLIQPIRVKAFLGNHNKTVAADAKAICEAELALLPPKPRNSRIWIMFWACVNVFSAIGPNL